MKKHVKAGVGPMAVLLLLGGVFLWWLSSSISGIRSGAAVEGRRQLEQALWRAAVVCYTTEGSYPPDVEYLVEHYGIQIDTERYVVQYQVQGQNLMPDITVLEAGDAG